MVSHPSTTATVLEREPRRAQRWTARLCLLLAAAAVVLVLVAGFQSSVTLLLVVAAAVTVMIAAAYWFLAHRGPVRWLAAALAVAAPVVVLGLLLASGRLLPVLVVVGLVALAGVAGRAALGADEVAATMPEYDVPPPARPFFVMNPRSGGGKVGRFGLKEKAEALGAEVALLEGPEQVDVAELARDAVARGADLLGAAGGDGTQALVAGVAAEHDVPFVVLSAGTRNHFALDLGLDREDPAAGLGALTDDAVELHVDLGMVQDRPFVNNASFGAYAAVVQSPAYRADKTRTALNELPGLLAGHTGARLEARVDGRTITAPQAVLVSNDPYGTGDLAGMGRRARLDEGVLGVVAVTVGSAREAVGLMRHTRDGGLMTTTAPEVVLTSPAGRIPAGIDGEAVELLTPVHCTIRSQALRVRVPRQRPGMLAPRAPWSWVRLRHLAGVHHNGGAANGVGGTAA